MTASTLPPIDVLKQHAKRLRAALAEEGDFISHCEALELIAKQNGRRDWNSLYAAAGNRPPRLDPQIGARVAGAYLGRDFSGVFIAVETLSEGRRRVTIGLDEPVDVVTFDSFSAYRSRITCVIDENGVSPSRTSNGKPHLELRR